MSLNDDQISRTSGAPTSEWGWQLIGVLAAAMIAAVFVNWSLASFYGIDIAASIGFPGNDSSWCDTTKNAFGLHCWSDFTLIRFDSLTSYPATFQSATIGVEQAYPLSTRLVRIPFFLIEELLGFKAALLAFLAAITACLFVPTVWATRGSPWHERALVLLVGAVATAPFLVVWDRGNIYAFTVPLLLLAMVGVIRDRPWLTVAAAVAAATVKPQYGGIALILLALRYWLPALVAIAGSVAAVLVPFLLVGGRSVEGVKAWLGAASSLNQRLPLTVDLPQNISFARLFVRVTELASRAGELVGLDMSTVRGWVEAPIGNWTAVSLCFVGLMALLLIIVGPKLDRSVLAISFIALVSLAPTLSYLYYFGFCLPALAVILRPPATKWKPHGALERSVCWALSAAIVCALTPLVIPMRSLTATGQPQLVASWLPLAATALFAVALVLAVVSGAMMTARDHQTRFAGAFKSRSL